MVDRIRLNRSAVAAEPYLPWNAFVDVVSLNAYEDLTPIQRIAHLVFWYESEVQNGGHLQYFENQGLSHIDETIEALVAVGAAGHAAVLTEASSRYLSRDREAIRCVEEFVAAALAAEFEEADSAFHQCQPDLQRVLERYLQRNLTEFVEIA